MLAAGTYRGRLGGQVYQADDVGLNGVYQDAGRTTGNNAPMRVAMFGRTKVMYSLRQQATMQERDTVNYGRAQTRESFQTQPGGVRGIYDASSNAAWAFAGFMVAAGVGIALYRGKKRRR